MPVKFLDLLFDGSFVSNKSSPHNKKAETYFCHRLLLNQNYFFNSLKLLSLLFIPDLNCQIRVFLNELD